MARPSFSAGNKSGLYTLAETPVSDELFAAHINELRAGAGGGPTLLVGHNLMYAKYTDIATAIADLPVIGGKIVLQEGTFELPAVAFLVDNLIIEGQGIGNTIIKQASGLNSNVLYANGKTNFTLRDFSIDGNKANNPTGDNGLVLYSCTNFIVENVESYNNKLKGFVLADACKDGRFLNVEGHLNDQDGIAMASGTAVSGDICERIKVAHGNFHDNTLYGIGLVVPTTAYLQTKDITLFDNDCVDNGSYGIEVFGAYGPRIINNFISGNGNHGIDLGSIDNVAYLVSRATIALNTVKNPSSEKDGIRLQSIDYSIITENHCYDDQATKTQRYGIGINQADRCIVYLNDCYPNKTDGINGAVTNGYQDCNIVA